MYCILSSTEKLDWSIWVSSGGGGGVACLPWQTNVSAGLLLGESTGARKIKASESRLHDALVNVDWEEVLSAQRVGTSVLVLAWLPAVLYSML